MQTAPSKMLLEIYTTNELTQDSEFFSLQIYSGTFQKVIAFCDRFIALVDRVKKSLLGTISLSKMHFIDVFHIFVNALLSEYSEIRMNAMYMKHWQGWGEYDRLERGPTNNTGSYDTSLSYNWEYTKHFQHVRTCISLCLYVI